MKLRTKLPLIIIPLIILPLLITGWLASNKLAESSIQRSHQQIDNLLVQMHVELKQLLDTAKANVVIFSDDPLLKNYLLTEDEQERYALLQRPLQKKLTSIQLGYPDYYEIRVMLPVGFEDLRLVSRDIDNQVEQEGESPGFLHMHLTQDDISSRIAVNPDNQELSLYVSKRIRLINPAIDAFTTEAKLRGYFSLTISLDSLFNLMQTNTWPQGGILLTDDAGDVLYNTGELSPDTLAQQYNLNASLAANSDMHYLTFNGQRYHHHLQQLHDHLWAHLFIPDSVLLSESLQIRQLVLTMTLIVVMVTVPFLLWLIRRQFIQPIEQLNGAFDRLSRDEKLIQIPSQQDDEIGDLTRSFNEMSLALHQSNQQIRNLAFHDNLTGLPNRLLFAKTLRRKIEEARQTQKHLALLFLDLDNFKNINDTMGHPVGDQLLIKVTELIQSNLRSYDYLCRPGYEEEGEEREEEGYEDPHNLARLGGDEFTLLLTHLEAELLAGPVAERIIRAFSDPIELSGTHCYVGCSIGIAIYPNDGDNVEDLVKHADLAMYQAKMQGKNTYQFFCQDIAQRSKYRTHLDQRLHKGVENLNFHLHYQPIVDSQTRKTVAVEALIRWHDPELGMVTPDQFIPLAEENGLIIAIGEWVMHEAARQRAIWKNSNLPPIRVAINVSSVQLNQPNLVLQFATALSQHALEPDDIYVELTETALLSGDEHAKKNLHALKEMGIKIALDDFGTGYSSLSYLQNLPIDILKIDRSFVMNLQEKNNRTILHAIITMAHSLNMKVIAEGVEDYQHLSFLSHEGCDLLQGYLFSTPRSAAEIENLFVISLPASGSSPEYRDSSSEPVKNNSESIDDSQKSEEEESLQPAKSPQPTESHQSAKSLQPANSTIELQAPKTLERVPDSPRPMQNRSAS